MEKELDVLWGIVVAATFIGLLFTVTMLGTGPTQGERERLADSLVIDSRPTGVQWR